MNTNPFEELILAARDAKLPYSFYANEDNAAIFIVKRDRFGRDELLEVFTEKDETGKDTFYTWWFRGKSYDRPEYAVRAAARFINVKDY